MATLAKRLNDGGDLEAIRSGYERRKSSWPTQDQQHLQAAGLVLIDLKRQGWMIHCRGLSIEVASPDLEMTPSKEEVRAQELEKRDEQMRQPTVQKFLLGMEARRLYKGQFISVFDLMRDGAELAESLRKIREVIDRIDALSVVRKTISPYIQVASEGESCEHTGYRLQDIWRYFRSTWSTQNMSIPGRTMLLLVRDAAVPLHPVIGLAALSSSIVQLGDRDVWLGWDPDTFLREISSISRNKLCRWLEALIEENLSGIYFQDLIERGILSRRDLRVPSEEVVGKLRDFALSERQKHQRFIAARELKVTRKDQDWKSKARSHLFASKRALALSDVLEVKMHLALPLQRGERVEALLQSRDPERVFRKLVRRVKADRVGTAIADISVCGALPPYSSILGGKLVSALVVTPEVVDAYRSRYEGKASEIASAVAGRPIVKPADLVFVGTTSLYAVGSSQYNRIKIPAEVLGGSVGEWIRYEKLGKSKSYGTSHFSNSTVSALTALTEQSSAGQRVNSIFGEGVNPKLRKVRQGLDLLGLDSDAFLRHGKQRIVYGVKLVSNLKEYLLRLHTRPRYMIAKKGRQWTSGCVEWWTERWLLSRIHSDDVLTDVSANTLVHPIRHGARPTLHPETY